MPAEPQNDEIVRLEQVVKVYSTRGANVEVQALRGISLTIRRNEYVAIAGASASGKSTLMNVIGCLDRPTAGTYRLCGEDVCELSDDQFSDVRGRRVGFIFQSFNLIQSQTVRENLEVPMVYQGVTPHERRAHAQRLAERVGLAGWLRHRPNGLSGEQQQRVAIARALMNDPVMLLADEPTGNLDSKTGPGILDLLDELNASGITIVVATHDQSVARRCRRVIELSDGLIHSDSAGAASAPAE